MAKATTTKVAPKKIGAPSKYTQEIADKIIDLIEKGKSERQIAKMTGMPCAATIRSWKDAHPDFLARSIKARKASAEIFNDKALTLMTTLEEKLMNSLESGQEFPKGSVEAFRVLLNEHARQAALRDDNKFSDRKKIQVEEVVNETPSSLVNVYEALRTTVEGG